MEFMLRVAKIILFIFFSLIFLRVLKTSVSDAFFLKVSVLIFSSIFLTDGDNFGFVKELLSAISIP